MTIRRIVRERNCSVKLSDDEFKKYKRLQRIGFNVSELIRAFMLKINRELDSLPPGVPPWDYIKKLEEKLGIKD